MATVTVTLSDQLKAMAEARAAEAGFSDVGEYIARLIQGEAAGAPESLSIHTDEELEDLLLTRLDGAAVDMDAADFARMREKLKARLDGKNPAAGQAP